MLLADYAAVSDGKLTIVGGGWSQTGPEPASFGIGLLIQVVAFGGEFEVGRPPGLKPGTPLDFPVAVNSTPLPLEPGRYEWRLTIDGASREDWTLPFTVRSEEQ